MKKRLATLIVVFLVLLNTSYVFAYTIYTFSAQANKGIVNISVNGKEDKLHTYNIYDRNYVRLGDICELLNWKIDVDKETGDVYLDTTMPYVGNLIDEKGVFTVQNENVEVKQMNVFVNGINLGIKSFDINGYNYFRLRDVEDITMVAAMHPVNSGKQYCLVDWDDKNKTIIINETIISPEWVIENLRTPCTNEEYKLKVIELINIEREVAGAEWLKSDDIWNKLIISYEVFGREWVETREFTRLDYDGYTLPIYSSTTEELNEYEYSHKTLTMVTGYWFTPAEIVEKWMNSEGEKNAILNPSYKNIEVDYTGDGIYAKHAIVLIE